VVQLGLVGVQCVVGQSFSVYSGLRCVALEEEDFLQVKTVVSDDGVLAVGVMAAVGVSVLGLQLWLILLHPGALALEGLEPKYLVCKVDCAAIVADVAA